ncbi:hypothetical protein PX52LOC_02184 [Limnoglobus roseus]|uniref:Uncharacterized protein n=1 Tax=Limnoglobus roseus TaxID=2598579 RepID=A0A5C1A7J8_9BACT|nr:hypothetical protein PX52LOC_02184 [Limnoglobus roseus]
MSALRLSWFSRERPADPNPCEVGNNRSFNIFQSFSSAAGFVSASFSFFSFF